MNHLTINLNEQFKSFTAGFSQSLNGDLIILSGINGSGKTQLINIIRGFKGNEQFQRINRLITLNGNTVEIEHIAHKSIRDYMGTSELTQADVVNSRQVIQTILGWYNTFRLDPNNSQSNNFMSSCQEARRLVISKLGVNKFNSGHMTSEELSSAIPRDFVIYSDDIFENRIGEIFYNYASMANNFELKSYREHNQFDATQLPVPPWTQLNNLFREMKFGYRFKPHYYRTENDTINEQPAIFACLDNGELLLEEKRSLSDLSDGEKAIISLTFAVLASEKTQPQILILDEYDAPLNPSLLGAFFTVLNSFFVKQGCQVIVVTHSPATLSLAPKNTNFYEVFKPKVNTSRVLKVNVDEYEELRVANGVFYSKIDDQASRIEEITIQNSLIQQELDQLMTQTKPFVFVEGDIDIQYLEKAAEHFPEWRSTLDKVELKDKNGTGDLNKYWKNRNEIREFIKNDIILLFDCDTNKENDDDGRFHKRVIPTISNHSIKFGIENLIPDETILTAEITGVKYTKKSIPNTAEPDNQHWKVIDDQKRNLSNWICNNAQPEAFKAFESIFNEINTLIR